MISNDDIISNVVKPHARSGKYRKWNVIGVHTIHTFSIDQYTNTILLDDML